MPTLPLPPIPLPITYPGKCERRDRGELNELRNKAVQMLFKQLTSAEKGVVEVAQAGLAAVIRHQRMPRQLLQSSLRPILVQLAFYHKLQLPLLKGLACLLQLLSNWFNITLGAPRAAELAPFMHKHLVVFQSSLAVCDDDEQARCCLYCIVIDRAQC